jgi:hypothetical protein
MLKKSYANVYDSCILRFKSKVPPIINGFEGITEKESRSYERFLTYVKFFLKCKIMMTGGKN